MKSFALLLFTCCSIGAYSQITPASLSSMLTGKEKKEWVVTAWKLVMGTNSNNQCKDGESYVFHKDGKVDRKRCIDGRIVKDTVKWDVQRRAGDNILIMGAYEYQARAKVKSTSELQLRTWVYDADKRRVLKEMILKYEKY